MNFFFPSERFPTQTDVCVVCRVVCSEKTVKVTGNDLLVVYSRSETPTMATTLLHIADDPPEHGENGQLQHT